MLPPPKSDLARDGGTFFDCASLAKVPPDIKRRVLAEEIEWEPLVAAARNSIGSLLAPVDDGSYTYDPRDHINLFPNTTNAFGRLLFRINQSFEAGSPTALTTDLEFPGCMTAIDDSWDGPVVMAQIASGLMSTQTDSDDHLRNALLRSFNFVKPRVVFLSHIMRTTGQVLPTKILRHFREANPRVIIVMDGSQAIGNIVVKAEVLQHVDFYIASGHKWLGGMTASGFVWQRDPGRWDVADRAQAVSHSGYLGGTGNDAAWSSLVTSIDDMVQDTPARRLDRIEQHNRSLSRVFRDELGAVRDVRVVTPYQRGRAPSGLVTISVDPGIGIALERRLREADVKFTALDYEPVRWTTQRRDRFVIKCDPVFPSVRRVTKDTPARPTSPRKELRFCFHYWHTEDDVRALARIVGTAVREADGRRAGATRRYARRK